MVSVTVSAVRPIGAGTARGVTATGTKAAGARQAYPFAPGGSPNARGVPGCADRSTPTAVRGGHRSLARSPGLPRTRQRVLARPHCFGSSPPTHLHQCDGSERKRLRASGAGCSCWSAYCCSIARHCKGQLRVALLTLPQTCAKAAMTELRPWTTLILNDCFWSFAVRC